MQQSLLAQDITGPHSTEQVHLVQLMCVSYRCVYAMSKLLQLCLPAASLLGQSHSLNLLQNKEKKKVLDVLSHVKGQDCLLFFQTRSEKPLTQLNRKDSLEDNANQMACLVIPDMKAKGKEEKESRIHCYFRILGQVFLLDYEM